MANAGGPSNFESVRAAVVAFLQQCEPRMAKYRDRQNVKSAIKIWKSNDISQALMSGVKSTGVTRKVDDLGRLVIPKELRTTYGIDVGDPLEIFMDPDAGTIVFQKYNMTKCAICGSEEDVTPIKGKYVCEDCIAELFEGAPN